MERLCSLHQCILASLVASSARLVGNAPNHAEAEGESLRNCRAVPFIQLILLSASPARADDRNLEGVISSAVVAHQSQALQRNKTKLPRDNNVQSLYSIEVLRMMLPFFESLCDYLLPGVSSTEQSSPVSINDFKWPESYPCGMSRPLEYVARIP